MEYSAGDLVQGAHDRDFQQVKQRLVVDWVQRGLLDKPRKTGRGAGGGRGSKKGVWPEAQAELFFTLLDQHQRAATRIPTLCNIPVFVWLWWGDDYVPVRQVRRALGSYAGAYAKSSLAAGRYSARALTKDLGNPRGSRAQRRARQDFIETMAEATAVGRLTEAQRSRLVDLCRQVLAPEVLASPMGAAFTEGYVQLVEARLSAIPRLSKLSPLEFCWARHVYVNSRVDYAHAFPWLAQDAAFGSRFRPPTLDETGNHACIDLLTVIGYIEIAKKEEPDSVKGAYFDSGRSPLAASFAFAPAPEDQEVKGNRVETSE